MTIRSSWQGRDSAYVGDTLVPTCRKWWWTPLEVIHCDDGYRSSSSNLFEKEAWRVLVSLPGGNSPESRHRSWPKTWSMSSIRSPLPVPKETGFAGAWGWAHPLLLQPKENHDAGFAMTLASYPPCLILSGLWSKRGRDQGKREELVHLSEQSWRRTVVKEVVDLDFEMRDPFGRTFLGLASQAQLKILN